MCVLPPYIAHQNISMTQKGVLEIFIGEDVSKNESVAKAMDDKSASENLTFFTTH